MYKRSEYGQVTRAFQVLDALRGLKQGRWIGDVAKEIGSSERTVRRDIEELREAGFEIPIRTRDKRAFACLVEERNFTPVPITRRERFTLLAVRNVFDVLRGTSLHDDIDSVMAKLEPRLGQQARAEVEAFTERFLYLPDHGTKSYEGKEDVIDAIQTGIQHDKVIKFRYANARGRAQSGYLAPFGMILFRNALYAVGARLRDPDTDARTAPLAEFAVERFIEAEHLRARTFARPSAFNLRSVLHGAFGPHLPDAAGPHVVTVEFSAARAGLAASRTWHPTQRVEPTCDGRVRVSFDVPHLAPVVSWVLEWGPHARAITPPLLVEQVKAELAQALQLYEGAR